MLALLAALLIIALVAAAVLVFATGPARGHDVPGFSDVVEKLRPAFADEPSPAYGVLSSPERDRAARQRFERAEESVQRVLRRLGRPFPGLVPALRRTSLAVLRRGATTAATSSAAVRRRTTATTRAVRQAPRHRR